MILRFSQLLLAGVLLLAACASPAATDLPASTAATRASAASKPAATRASGARASGRAGEAPATAQPALVATAASPFAGVEGTNSSALTVIPPAPAVSAATGDTMSGAQTPAATTASRSVRTLPADLVEPDDLAVDPDGSLYVSDVGDGTIRRIAPDGHVTLLLSGLGEPEGMVVLPDGVLIIAEQSRNRLLRFDPATGQLAPLFQLTNRSGATGVDGIALDGHDPALPSLLVPDSANGTLLRVSLDGKQVQTLARGFVRPVAAWAEADGSILVADEFGNRLVRLRPDGQRQSVATLPQPDDVVEDAAGHIYVNSLQDGAIHEIDLQGTDRIVASGLGMPQGLAFEASGKLVATDPGHHRVVRLEP